MNILSWHGLFQETLFEGISMKKSFIIVISLFLSWALNCFAVNNVGMLKSEIISFAMDPNLSIIPREGQVIIKEEGIRLEISKAGLSCLSTNCKPSISIDQIFEAPMVEIYQDECKNIHYEAYKSDALANDQDVYIEVIDYLKNICPIFISNSPTEISLKTTHVRDGEKEKYETQSKMMAGQLTEKL
jgi:hypothetical protein